MCPRPHNAEINKLKPKILHTNIKVISVASGDKLTSYLVNLSICAKIYLQPVAHFFSWSGQMGPVQLLGCHNTKNVDYYA